ncbi:hypothetical protein RJ640_014596, partial [Escallonia rubra]
EKAKIMGSQTHKLPTIDFSSGKMKADTTSSWIAACDEVRHALEEYGCFVAVYDKVCLELNDVIIGGMEALFSLPLETKSKNVSKMPFFGYVGHQPTSPLYESMGIENATALEEAQSFTKLMWPAGNDPFSGTIHLYSKLVSELEQIVKRMVFQSYGVGKYGSETGSYTYLLKLMKYKVPTEGESNIGVEAHQDKSFLTILHSNQVNGLEVQTKDGEWIGLEPRPSSFVVMAGDAFMVWSNGRIPSPNHRVLMSGDQARYSLALFSFNDGVIQVPEEVVDDEHPLQFKPFDHFGYFRFCMAHVGKRKFEHLTEEFCGVLFSLPEDTKSRNVSKMPSFGFVGYHPNVPIYESMGIENATVFEEAQSFTNLMWADGNGPFWCGAMIGYDLLIIECS